ncbi:hypothetical protein ABZU91_01255, partial [Micromonospora sp. NPDC005174]
YLHRNGYHYRSLRPAGVPGISILGADTLLHDAAEQSSSTWNPFTSVTAGHHNAPHPNLSLDDAQVPLVGALLDPSPIVHTGMSTNQQYASTSTHQRTRQRHAPDSSPAAAEGSYAAAHDSWVLDNETLYRNGIPEFVFTREQAPLLRLLVEKRGTLATTAEIRSTYAGRSLPRDAIGNLRRSLRSITSIAGLWTMEWKSGEGWRLVGGSDGSWNVRLASAAAGGLDGSVATGVIARDADAPDQENVPPDTLDTMDVDVAGDGEFGWMDNQPEWANSSAYARDFTQAIAAGQLSTQPDPTASKDHTPNPILINPPRPQSRQPTPDDDLASLFGDTPSTPPHEPLLALPAAVQSTAQPPRRTQVSSGISAAGSSQTPDSDAAPADNVQSAAPADNVQSAAPEAARTTRVSAGMNQAALSAAGVQRPWAKWTVGPVVVPPGRGVEVDPSGRVYWLGERASTAMKKEVLAAAAGFVGEVIFLGVRPGRAATADSLAAVRCLALHLALGRRPRVVVTPANIEGPLTELSEASNVSIVHPVIPKRSPGQVSLGQTWTARLGTDLALGATLTAAGLTNAARQAKAQTEVVTPALRELLLAPDRGATLTILNEYRQELTSSAARTDLDKIVDLVQGDSWFTRFKPLLGELGTPDAAPIVLDYQRELVPATRNFHLITDHARSIDPATDLRVDLIKQSGHPADGADIALHAVDLLFVKGIDTAKAYVHEHSRQLRNEQKSAWVNAIAKLAVDTERSEKRTELQELANVVMDC